MKFRRYDRMLAMILVFAITVGASACKRRKASSQDTITETKEAISDTSGSDEVTEPGDTSVSDTDTEATTTTESSIPSESSDATSSESSDTTGSDSEIFDPTDTTSPSENTSAPTETTKAPATPKPTKAPKQTKATSAPTTAPKETTPAPKETTPKPVETTQAPSETTPKPVETTPEPKSKDPGLRKGTAISAAKAAVQDKCGSHDGFEFNDTMMSNEQARARACSDNKTFYGHNQISGTFIPLEAAASLTGYIFEDGSEQYSWTDHSGVEHTYSNFYDCVYACAAYGVTEHTTKLSSESSYKYYGVGFYGFNDPLTEQEYGIITYKYYLYIGGDDDIARNYRGY